MLIEKPVSEGSIVTLKLANGEEMIAKLVREDVLHYIVAKPVVLSLGQKGVALLPYLMTVNPDKELSINKSAVIVLTATEKEFADQYIQATTGITVAR